MRKKTLSSILLISLLTCFVFQVYSGGVQEGVEREEVLEPLEDGFPSDTITLANPFPPDHTEAIHARAMAEALNKYSPVEVISKSLSSGPTAHYAAWQDAKEVQGGTEGYINYTISWTGLMSRMLTRETHGYMPEDLISSALIVSGQEPALLLTQADAQWDTWEELAEWARETGDLRVASSNIGSGYHIGMVVLGQEADIPWSPVPTDGQGEATLTMLGGGTEVAISNTTLAKSLVEEGKAKVLLQFMSERSELWPDVVSTGELGYRSFARTIGHCTHPNVAENYPERKAWLEKLFEKAFQEPVYQDYLKKNAFVKVGIVGDEAVDFVREIYDMILPITVEYDLLKDELK